ncbi:MAG TPA: OadG family protein [Pirellulaceae bacterium]|nr:OadG family protein [Pirellulaceae bacterium]
MIFAQQYYGIRNITEYEGIGVSITGISIVFAALVLISLFITSLPRVLAMLESVLPPEPKSHAATVPTTSTNDHDEAVVAAIGFALHARHRKKN